MYKGIWIAITICWSCLYVHALKSQSFNDKNPIWSPNAKSIAFESDREGDSNIYIVDPYGSNLVQITSNPSRDMHPTWSPDGSAIVFQSNRSGNWDLWKIQLSNKEAVQMTNDPGTDSFASWSPDGKYISFTSNRSGDAEIYLIKSDGTGLRKLTDSNGFDAMAKWFPNSEELIFVSGRNGINTIYMISLETLEVQLILQSSTTALLPIVSSDGLYMTYIQSGDNGRSLWRYDFRSQEEQMIKSVQKPSTAMITSDGRIAFDTQTDAGYRIFILNEIDGSIVPLSKK